MWIIYIRNPDSGYAKISESCQISVLTWYFCICIFADQTCKMNYFPGILLAGLPFFIGPRWPWGPIYGSESFKPPFANLTDVTLADEGTNSILTDNANRAIQGNVAMHVTLPGGQLWNQCKWCHLVAKFATNASGAIWWLNLQLK